MFKFAVFLALALYSVQALPSASLKYTTLDVDVLGIGDVIQELWKLIERAYEIIKNIASGLIEKLKEAIDKLIGDISHGTEVGRKCSKAHEEEMKELQKNAQEGIQKCLGQAKEDLEPLKEDFDKVRKEFEDEVDLIQREIKECSGDNPSIATSAYCTVKENIKELGNLRKILYDAIETIKADKEKVVEINASLYSCGKNVTDKSIEDVKVIAEKIKKCIANGGNESY